MFVWLWSLPFRTGLRLLLGWARQRQLVLIFPGWHIAVPTYLLETKKIVLFFPRAGKKTKTKTDFWIFFRVFFSHDRFFFPQKIMGTYLKKNLVGFFFFPTYQAGKKTGFTYLFLRKRPKYDLLPRKKKNQLLLEVHHFPRIFQKF